MNQPRRTTTDRDYADLLVRLAAVPAPKPVRRTYTKPQERAHLVEDLTAINGEAPW